MVNTGSGIGDILNQVRQDPAETFAPLGELMTKMLLFGSVMLIGLGGIGVVVARRIARPIRLLHDGVQQIGSGRLEQRVELNTGAVCPSGR